MDPQGACTTGRSLHGQEGGSVLASAGAVPTSAAAPPPLPAGARIDDASDEESSGGDFQGSFTSGHGSFTSGSKSMGAKNVTDYMREQDRFMPIANIAKIMARELAHTGHAKISQDTKTLMQECATEFICFIMSEANDQAAQAKRKAVSGQDIINACQNMDMRELVQPMTNALPHLQPPKRLRGKAAEDALGQQPARRRRCRVSDEEVEQIRQARDARLGEEKDTMVDTHSMM